MRFEGKWMELEQKIMCDFSQPDPGGQTQNFLSYKRFLASDLLFCLFSMECRLKLGN